MATIATSLVHIKLRSVCGRIVVRPEPMQPTDSAIIYTCDIANSKSPTRGHNVIRCIEHCPEATHLLGIDEVLLPEQRLRATTNLLALRVEHVLDNCVVNVPKGEQRCSFCGPVLSLCHKARQQFTNPKHVLDKMDHEVVELGLDAGPRVQSLEQCSPLTDYDAQLVQMFHCTLRACPENGNHMVQPIPAFLVLSDGVVIVTWEDLLQKACQDGNQ